MMKEVYSLDSGNSPDSLFIDQNVNTTDAGY